MVEPEIAYGTLDDLMELAEGLLTFLVKRCFERAARPHHHRPRSCEARKNRRALPPHHLRRSRHKIAGGHAQGVIENKFEWGGDLGSPDETYLSSLYDRPSWSIAIPPASRPSTWSPIPSVLTSLFASTCSPPKATAKSSADRSAWPPTILLLQRIHDHNLPEEAFKWYLDLRKYGSVPHSGFGMGIERAVAWICGLEHVRETIPFPRMLHRLYP
jgi:asparaginyl-tRNA synthetase